jgi:hypothetical protein
VDRQPWLTTSKFRPVDLPLNLVLECTHTITQMKMKFLIVLVIRNNRTKFRSTKFSTTAWYYYYLVLRYYVLVVLVLVDPLIQLY